jgi:glutaredoxin
MMSSSKVSVQGPVWRSARLLLLGCAAAALALPAQALYKVVGPDGKVTYTDRPPGASEGKVTPLSATGGAAPVNQSELPLELRQVAARYPVTLFVIRDCTPCDAGRSLLRQRGIPHTERIVVTDEDADAVLRLIGTRDLPALTLGAQVLRGFSAETWDSYLDTAGYPRESRLPAGYQFAAATPVTPRAEVQRPAPAASAPAAAARPTAPTTSAAPSGIRF